jgi:hypothetical protein
MTVLNIKNGHSSKQHNVQVHKYVYIPMVKFSKCVESSRGIWRGIEVQLYHDKLRTVPLYVNLIAGSCYSVLTTFFCVMIDI